ncbi:MAG: DUF4159 domain-containing protein [Planctomycetota bacterium]
MRYLIVLLVVAAPAAAQEPFVGQGKAPLEPGRRLQVPQREALVVQVKDSIDRGVQFLRSQQIVNARRDVGSWELTHVPPVMEGGQTCLATLALLTCGVPANDPAVQNGLKYIRQLESRKTYIRALQAIVLAEANLPEDRALLRSHVEWLIEARVVQNGKLTGWDYSNMGQITDNSNTQYAVLGLWAGKQAGIDIKNEIFEGIRQYYLENQDPKDGAWIYASGLLVPSNQPSITMTTAGISGLLITAMELNAGREVFAGPADVAKNCGVYADSKAIERGFGWIDRKFTLDVRARTFYHLYGLERAGRLSGQRFFGEYDWYREGSKFLIPMQKQDGSWYTTGAWDQWPVVSTSLALLFLSKGRTPVLMSKLVHGAWPRQEMDLDWNNDRNDLRHITAHASKEIFKKQPLAWQTVDVMKAAIPPRGRNNLTEDDLQALTSDLLQSPILYITGHNSPKDRFTATEKDLLRRYVDNGGFILAEACCGSPNFDLGFRALVAEIWPDNDLSPIGPEHPVWQTPAVVTPGQPHTLFGLNQGCKTVLMYSPQDLSCRWETNKPEDPRCIQAFRLGLNIIAYATGMQPPQPRLYQPPVATNKTDPAVIPRGTLKVAQLKHSGDWHPAPKAMRNLMEHINQFAGIDVALKTETRPIHDRELIDFKFLYMHGRAAFKFDPDELSALRFNLKNGGLLFADACCGKDAFDQSFRKFVEALLPGAKLERVPPSDPLFSKDLAGEALTEQTIRGRTQLGQPLQNMTPYLEGIRHEGRWIVLYSKYDIGCALEKHQSADCRGYDTASAQRIARAAVLYTLSP